MGMFGFLATLVSGGFFVTQNLKETEYVANNREVARKDGKVTYADGKGRDYLTSTGEQVLVQSGKIYSLKNTNQVLYDMNQVYYAEENQKRLAEAKKDGKKYILSYYHPNSAVSRGYSPYTTEISTMKPFSLLYDVRYYNGYHWIYYKQYLTGNGKLEKLEQINEEEFKELGGCVPNYITPETYFYKKICRCFVMTNI